MKKALSLGIFSIAFLFATVFAVVPVSVLGQTVGSTGTLTASVDIANTPDSKIVIAGSTMQKVGSFKFTAQNTSFTIQDLRVKTFGESNNSSISSITLKYKDAGGLEKIVSQPILFSSTGGLATYTGLSAYIPQNTERDIDVYVDVQTVENGANSGALIIVSLDSSGGFKAFDSNGNVDTTLASQDLSSFVTSGKGTLVVRKSFPTLSAVALDTSRLYAGTNINIGRVKITANSAGDIGWKKIIFTYVRSPGLIVGSPKLYDLNSGQEIIGTFSNPTTGQLIFTPTNEEQIAAGSSVTYALHATISGLNGENDYLDIGIANTSTTGVTSSASSVETTGPVSPSFVWTDRSASVIPGGSVHSLNTLDWTNDRLIKNLPLNLVGNVDFRGGTVTPPVTPPPTDDSTLIAQLQALLAQLLEQLKAQGYEIDANGNLVKVTPVTPITPPVDNGGDFCYSWTRNLTVGMRGDDVDALIKALVREGFMSHPETPHITGEDFTEEVAEAVSNFQTKYGISPRSGFVGPLTRANLNARYVCSSQTPSITVLSPNGGENYSAGTVVSVAFNTTGLKVGSYYEIAVVQPNTGGTVVDQTLVSRTLSTLGTQKGDVVLPRDLSNGYYRMRIVVYDGDGTSKVFVQDQSDSEFRIFAADPVTNLPSITGVSGMAAGNFEIDAGGRVAISGVNLSSDIYLPEASRDTTTKVYIGGMQVKISQLGSDLIYVVAPESLIVGQTYDVFVSNSFGTSNAVKVRVIGNVAPPISKVSITSSVEGDSGVMQGSTQYVSFFSNNVQNSGIIIRLSSLASTTNSVYEEASDPAIQNGLNTLSFSIPPTFPLGNAKLYVISNADQNVFGVTDVNVIPQGTTPPPGDNLGAELLRETGDKAGQWYTFRDDGTKDWVWSMYLNLKSAKKIKAISIRHDSSNVSGEAWSTGSSNALLGKLLYPLVVTTGGGTQLNTSYDQLYSYNTPNPAYGNFEFPAGDYTLKLYGNTGKVPFDGGKIFVDFTDGTSVSSMISASDYNPRDMVTPVPVTYHPADTNRDGRITIGEVTAYTTLVGSGTYDAKIASEIWIRGEVYTYDASSNSYRDARGRGITVTTPVTPSITVLSPNGGEALLKGQTYTVRWSSTGVNRVVLDLVAPNSLNSVVVGNLVNITGNPGSISWTIPMHLSDGSYKLRVGTCPQTASVCSNDLVSLYDLSDSAITIVTPTVTPTTVVSPMVFSIRNKATGQVISGMPVSVGSSISALKFNSTTRAYYIDPVTYTATTDASGRATFNLPALIGDSYSFVVGNSSVPIVTEGQGGYSGTFTIPNSQLVFDIEVSLPTATVTPVPVPTPTPAPTPDPTPATPTIAQPSLSATLAQVYEDKAGRIGVFSAGPGNPGGSSGGNANDFAWNALLTLGESKTIKSIEINHSRYGEYWSTVNANAYPLVVFANGAQVNTAYGQTLGTYDVGTTNLKINGQFEYPYFSGGTMTITFTDNTTVTASIPAVSTFSPAVPAQTASALDAMSDILKRMLKQTR